ncbi:TetR/AcrR family transcriptional regulator [Leisingera sp.]|uniref:TetR/AcrR family transcriptional regulator n=1 Tax=Leisingera sp. TaxID=1879318 RepID=UPI002B26C194|nr:TetR/AcrR family transcriptional regulator [Leisingera sp.]
MTRAPQKRRLETRAKLLSVAAAIVQEQGYSGLRVEDVVARAGVAKGTLFSHFKDKDGLLAVLIGEEVTRLLDGMESAGAPSDIPGLTARLAPHLDYVAQDRVIFDLLLRYSGTTAAEPDEVVTASFTRQVALLARWLQYMQAAGSIRQSPPPQLLAEGIQAFLNHVLGVWFCMEHNNEAPPARTLEPYLKAWLQPPA